MPRQSGKQNLYLKFDQKDQLIGVKVEEIFQNKTKTIFVANDLKPKSELIKREEAKQQAQKASDREAAYQDALAKFKF